MVNSLSPVTEWVTYQGAAAEARIACMVRHERGVTSSRELPSLICLMPHLLADGPGDALPHPPVGVC